LCLVIDVLGANGGLGNDLSVDIAPRALSFFVDREGGNGGGDMTRERDERF
jgi:hypothetical protein